MVLRGAQKLLVCLLTKQISINQENYVLSPNSTWLALVDGILGSSIGSLFLKALGL